MAAVSETIWRRGRLRGGHGRPKLLFGRMFEDPAIEQRTFWPDSHAFCIASAACTSLALAQHGYRVTAVDVNPAQIDYMRRRLGGGDFEPGTVDRLLTLVRRCGSLLGVRRRDLHTFVRLDDPQAQFLFWRSHIDLAMIRRARRFFLSPLLLRFVYAPPLRRALPDSFGDVLWSRFERGISIHPNRTNPFAWRFFLGREPPAESAEPKVALPIELACADAADYLDNCPPNIFHGFSLSNIFDGADEAYVERLFRSLRRAAAPNARVLIRSFAEPRTPAERELAAADRSFIWGRIVSCTIDELADAEFV